MRTIKALILLLCALGLGFITYTHYYRPPFDDQFPFYNLPGTEPDEIMYFVESLPPHDSFCTELYYSIRSVEDAVAYIRTNHPNAEEAELARAAFDLTRRRFLHYMYPRHSLLTNPFLTILGAIAPTRTFDAMYLGDDLLRHSAGASCGQAAGVFIEIWRGLGGKARAYHLEGHDIAEAMVEGKLWTVDPDLETMAPYGIDELRADLELVAQAYGHLHQPDKVSSVQAIFSNPAVWHYLYEDPPSTSPRIYLAQKWLNRLKFAFFPALAALLLFFLHCRGRNRRQQNIRPACF